MRAPPSAGLSRTETDKLEEIAKGMGAKGLARAKVDDQGNWTQSPLAKSIAPEARAAINAAVSAKPGDLILFQFGKESAVHTVLANLRLHLGKRLELIPEYGTGDPKAPASWRFLWVVDPPLFEYDEESKKFVAAHHAFTRPHDDHVQYLETDPGRVLCYRYDLVLNGFEIGGGSIRLHDPLVQQRVFAAMGIGPEEAEKKFGFLLQALRFGAPPHGGIALGMDRPAKLACLDSGYIQRIAPHLLFHIPFLYPVSPKKPGEPSLADRALLYGAECYFEAYDKYQPLKNGKPHTRLTDEELHELEPGIVSGTLGAVTMDEYGIDPFRLCALNARSAAAHGATIRNHTVVTRLLREGAAVVGAEIEDARTGAREKVRARAVLNAGGPWAPKIAALAGVAVRIRPGKGVHLTLDRRLSNYGIICKAVDGRDVFVMPHEDSSIIGTTDDDFYGDPDELTVTQDEVEYLLQAVEHTFPSVRSARVLRAWAGVRPTLFAYGPLEDALSRDHHIYDHEEDGAPGFYSIVGGKLASFRAMAQEAVDLIAHKAGNSQPCRTHEVPLPGGEAA